MAIKSLKIKRTGKYKYVASWADVSKKCDEIEVSFTIWHGDNKHVLKQEKIKKTRTTCTLELTRKQYYPVKDGNKNKKRRIRVGVRLWKDGKPTKWDFESFWFKNPEDPRLSEVEFDKTKMTISTNLTIDNDSTKLRTERYQCRKSLRRKTSIKNGTSSDTYIYKDEVFLEGETGSISDVTLNHTEKDSSLPTYGDYIYYEFSVYAQGIRGNSKKAVSKYYLGWAYKTKISGIKVDKLNDTVNVTVGSDFINCDPWYPTTNMQLQYVYTSNINDGNLSWQEIGGEQGVTNACRCSYKDLMVNYEKGKDVYVRVMTTNDYGANSYSEPKKVPESYMPSNEQGTTTDVQVTTALAGTDGESIQCNIDWKKDIYNGTILGWSTDPDIWQSNTDPETYELTDDKWAQGKSETTGFENSAKIKIKGLDEATTYYFRARRYSTEDESSKSAWSSEITVGKTGTLPVGVTLSAPTTIAVEKPLSIAWAIGGEKPQTSWLIIINGTPYIGGEDATNTYTIPAEFLADKGNKILVQVSASNGGSFNQSNICEVQIKQAPVITIVHEDDKRFITTLPHYFSVSGTIGTELACKLISDGATSNMPDDTNRQFADDIVWSDAFTLTTETQEFSLPEDLQLIDGCDYTLEVTPTYDGVTGDTVSPSWTYTDTDEGEITTYFYTVAWAHQAIAPTDVTITTKTQGTAGKTIEMLDGSSEVLSAEDTGAGNNVVIEVSSTVEVESYQWYYSTDSGEVWSIVSGETTSTLALNNPTVGDYYKCLVTATDLNSYVVTTKIVAEQYVTDAYSAAITVNAPDGAATDDVFNVYRLTPDGTYLIAQDVAFGSTVTDRWAPYGTNNLEYRIATKTINNDYAWDDFPYTNSGKALRFDWEGGSVELPYNISINDSWEKDFEGVKYLDGTKSGYWNEGAARTSSLSTDVIRIKDAETERAVRELAKYAGSVFVRTPTGQAYEANVTVSADMTYDSSALSVSLDTEEIECVTYVCDSSDITGSEG